MGQIVPLLERRGLARMTEAQWRTELMRGVAQAISLERRSPTPNLTVIAQLDTVYESGVLAERECQTCRGPEPAA